MTVAEGPLCNPYFRLTGIRHSGGSAFAVVYIGTIRKIHTEEDSMFFESWEPIKRILILGPLSYIHLILFLRLSGKRTLTKLNSFDLVVTVALGSALTTIILNKQTKLSEGVTCFAVLVGLQYTLTFLSVRFKFFQNLIKNEPKLLVHEGKFIADALLAERVTEEEIRQCLRKEKIGSLEDVYAVVLETNGEMSVIQEKKGDARSSTLQGIVKD